ncbi:MAG: hypothetical protein SF097_20625 [Acidobacteriota bacterium]|nr:hypothetical protein [Acidobacteriota bacterium]
MRFIFLISMFCNLNVFCVPELNEARLKTLVKESDMIALAEVTDVQPPPGIWSGQFPVTQGVSYKVLEVFKGSLQNDTLSHNFYVIKNDPLSDKQKPQLSTSLFAKKKKQLLFLKSKPDVKESTDGSATVRQSTTTSPFEIGHVLLADRNTLKELKRILAR